jgi:hypothetical protein
VINGSLRGTSPLSLCHRELGAQNNTQLITTSASAEFIQPIAWALHKYMAKAFPSLHTPASSGNGGKKGVVE